MPLLALCLFFLAVIPAYAEVTLLQTDRSLYAIDMNVYFTGTVDKTDSQKLVNLMIQDPNGKLVLMTGVTSGSDGAFQITINTDDQSQFNLKGTYSATAFVNSESDGKTIFFDFSPDGSPVAHQTQGLQNSITSSQNKTESSEPLQTSNQYYKSALYENLSINDTMSMSKTTLSASQSLVRSTTGYDTESVLYPLMAVCGAGMVGFILYQRRKRPKGGGKSNITVRDDTRNKEDDALTILKDRLAKGEITIEEFKTTKDVLNEP